MKNQSFHLSRSNYYFRTVTLISLVAVFSLFNSCKEDEPAAEEEFSFKIENYTIDEGLVFDYGPVNYIDFEELIHYNYDFAVYDGSYNPDDESFQGSFFMITELLSPGISEFQEGTFSFLIPETTPQAAGQFYFNSAIIFVDANGNNTILETEEDEKEDLFYFATAGTIEVINNGNNNYTLNYSLTLQEADFTTEDLKENTAIDVEFSITTDFEIIEASMSGRTESGSKIFNK